MEDRILIIKGNLACKSLVYRGLCGYVGVKSNIPLSEISNEFINKAIIIEGNVSVESDLCVDYLLIVTGDIIMWGGLWNG